MCRLESNAAACSAGGPRVAMPPKSRRAAKGERLRSPRSPSYVARSPSPRRGRPARSPPRPTPPETRRYVPSQVDSRVLVPVHRAPPPPSRVHSPPRTTEHGEEVPDGFVLDRHAEELEDLMMSEGLDYLERQHLWSWGVRSLAIYNTLRDEDFAAEGIARPERMIACNKQSDVLDHTELAERIKWLLEAELQGFQLRRDGSDQPLVEPQHLVDDDALSRHAGGFSQQHPGSGGFRPHGEDLDDARQKLVRLKTAQEDAHANARDKTRELKEQRDRRENGQQQLQELVRKGVVEFTSPTLRSKELNQGKLSDDGERKVLASLTCVAQLFALGLDDMRALDLSLLDRRLLDQIKSEALDNSKYDDVARPPGLIWAGRRGAAAEAGLTPTEQQHWDKLVALARAQDDRHHLPPDMHWTRQNERWVTSWIEAKSRERDSRSRGARSPQQQQQREPAARAGQSTPNLKAAGGGGGGGSPRYSPRPEPQLSTSRARVPQPVVSSDGGGGSGGSGGGVGSTELPEHAPLEDTAASYDTLSLGGGSLIGVQDARAVDRAAERYDIDLVRLERCGGAYFGGCSFCEHESFHIKQGAKKVATGMMGQSAVARNKAECFICKKETLACVTPGCAGFSKCKQSVEGDKNKDEGRCKKCKELLVDWSRDEWDRDYDPAEEYGGVLPARDLDDGSYSGSQHIRVEVVGFEQEGTHTQYVLRVTLGRETDEAYEIRKRFSDIATFATDLGRLDFKPARKQQAELGLFSKTVPTNGMTWKNTDFTKPENATIRQKQLEPWFFAFGEWASKLYSHKTGDAFVDFLRPENVQAVRESIKTFQPIRDFLARGTSRDVDRQAHLQVDVARYEKEGAGDKLHMRYVLRVTIGRQTDEAYEIRKRFSDIVAFATALGKLDFKPAPKEQAELGLFKEPVPTNGMTWKGTDFNKDENATIRQNELAPWFVAFGEWASKLYDRKTGDAFVDFLRPENAQAVRDSLPTFQPIRDFLALSSSTQSVRFLEPMEPEPEPRLVRPHCSRMIQVVINLRAPLRLRAKGGAPPPDFCEGGFYERPAVDIESTIDRKRRKVRRQPQPDVTRTHRRIAPVANLRQAQNFGSSPKAAPLALAEIARVNPAAAILDIEEGSPLREDDKGMRIVSVNGAPTNGEAEVDAQLRRVGEQRVDVIFGLSNGLAAGVEVEAARVKAAASDEWQPRAPDQVSSPHMCAYDAFSAGPVLAVEWSTRGTNQSEWVPITGFRVQYGWRVTGNWIDPEPGEIVITEVPRRSSDDPGSALAEWHQNRRKRAKSTRCKFKRLGTVKRVYIRKHRKCCRQPQSIRAIATPW